jgi:hypothetical protein
MVLILGPAPRADFFRAEVTVTARSELLAGVGVGVGAAGCNGTMYGAVSPPCWAASTASLRFGFAVPAATACVPDTTGDTDGLEGEFDRLDEAKGTGRPGPPCRPALGEPVTCGPAPDRPGFSPVVLPAEGDSAGFDTVCPLGAVNAS